MPLTPSDDISVPSSVDDEDVTRRSQRERGLAMAHDPLPSSLNHNLLQSKGPPVGGGCVANFEQGRDDGQRSVTGSGSKQIELLCQ